MVIYGHQREYRIEYTQIIVIAMCVDELCDRMKFGPEPTRFSGMPAYGYPGMDTLAVSMIVSTNQLVHSDS